jgi:hypothetical protein
MKQTISIGRMTKWLAALGLAVTLALASHPTLADSDPSAATALRAKLEELAPRLKKNQFNRPIDLQSEELANKLKGDIYALIDAPFASVSQSLIEADNWCDVLILHLNTKYCKTSVRNGSKKLLVSIGKKTYEELDQVFPIEFSFLPTQSTPEFFDIVLAAKSGPLGTSDYRIQLEAVALKSGGTFLHLKYSYAYNYFGMIAMQTYLATIGRGKVGFTQTRQAPGSTPDYISGMRGVVERNTMRYYLAIDAFLDSLPLLGKEQLAWRLERWFSATERYHRQLHELERADYLSMKYQEYARMKSSP